MQSSALPVPATSGLRIEGLLQRLGHLTDGRHPKGLRYALAPLLLLIILAKLAGEDRPSGIADWVRHRGQQLRRLLHLSWRRMPHHNTYRRILQEVVRPEELDQVVSEHLCSLPGVGHSTLIAIDGKTLRGTSSPAHPKGQHLLAAYLPEEGIVLMQLPAGDKENEIRVAPRLLAQLDLQGKVVVGDAMHTQRHLSRQIVEAGGDYLWLVKDNQPTLREDIAYLFTADTRTVLGGQVPHDFAQGRQVTKGHGRQECRTLTVSQALCGYMDWPGVAQVFCLERQRHTTRTGKEQREVVYGLTSLRTATAARLLEVSRRYWGIENGLHYRRDVTFQEDRTRQTKGRAGQVMAALNNLVIGLLRQTGAANLAQARRWCEATITLLLATAPAQLVL